jgi:hypothetical protein
MTIQQDRLWALSQLKHYAAGDDYLPEEAAKIYAETATKHFLLFVILRQHGRYVRWTFISASRKDDQRRVSQSKSCQALKSR